MGDVSLASILKDGTPRLPWEGEGERPALVPGRAQYIELPGMRFPTMAELGEHPWRHGIGMARNVPMMFGYTGGPELGAGALAARSLLEALVASPLPALAAAGSTALIGGRLREEKK